MPKYRQWLAHLFAHRCALCDGFATEALCAPCWHSLPRLHNCCPQCALPLEHSEALCADCLAHPKPFTRAFCVFPYVFPVDALVQQFKSRGYAPPIQAMGDELVELIAASGATYSALVPMPQHWRGLFKRGRNPAAEVAVYLAKKLKLPVRSALHKTHYTSAQKYLTRKERWQNLSGSLAAPAISGGCYLLVDDVLTTGASSILASQVLLDAGAERVDVAVLARTPQWRH